VVPSRQKEPDSSQGGHRRKESPPSGRQTASVVPISLRRHELESPTHGGRGHWIEAVATSFRRNIAVDSSSPRIRKGVLRADRGTLTGAGLNRAAAVKTVVACVLRNRACGDLGFKALDHLRRTTPQQTLNDEYRSVERGSAVNSYVISVRPPSMDMRPAPWERSSGRSGHETPARRSAPQSRAPGARASRMS
jgi:hypothetical protein